MEAIAGLIILSLILSGLALFLRWIIGAWRRFIGLEGSPSTSALPDGSRTIYYRSSNGRSDYKFLINHMSDGNYRIYILDQPTYASRDSGDVASHRLRDSNGNYICFTGRVRTIDQARSLAATWADKTEGYILRGERF